MPMPPLPCPPPNSDAPIYALGNGQYLVGNSDLESASSEQLCGMAMSASFILSPPGGGTGSGGGTAPAPDTRRNYLKFLGQEFSLLDTNRVSLTDTNLYNALLAFPSDANTSPVLQIAAYGTNSVLIKASHFDYSAETVRDFALLICDKAETPTWKNVDLSGSSDSQDGWLIQGTVPNWQVTDPMYLEVSNITNRLVNELPRCA